MSAIVHQDLIDASELDSLLQRLTTAQNDKERLRHLKTAARNYTFDGGQIARLLAPMAASPAAAVEAAVMLLRRAVPRGSRAVRVRCAVAKFSGSPIYEYLTPLARTFVLIPRRFWWSP